MSPTGKALASHTPSIHQGTYYLHTQDILDIYVAMNYHAALESKLQRVELVFHALLLNVCSRRKQLSLSILEKSCLLAPSLFVFIP